jgi:hypothetical protein
VAHLSRPSIKVVDSSTKFLRLNFGCPKLDNLRSQIGQELFRHRQLDLIDIAPRPLVARLEGSHHGMLRLMEVPCGMTAGRAVTTADVPANETKPKVNPRRTESQALFTPLGPGGSRDEPLQVMTAHNGSREECPCI